MRQPMREQRVSQRIDQSQRMHQNDREAVTSVSLVHRLSRKGDETGMQ